MQFGKKFIMGLLCLIAFLDLATTIQAKSVYVINDTDASEMRAYKVEDANLVHQTNHVRQNDPLGATDAVGNTDFQKNICIKRDCSSITEQIAFKVFDYNDLYALQLS